MINMTINATR